MREWLGRVGVSTLFIEPIPEGNPVTVSRLRAAGSDVFEFDAAEICLKGCGGPTCLTRPLDRSS